MSSDRIASCRSPTARDGQQQTEETQFLGSAEAVQGLQVFTDHVVREESGSAADRRRSQHGRRREHAITDAADFEDQAIREHCSDQTIQRGNHGGPLSRN